MPSGSNARKGAKGFQKTRRRPVAPRRMPNLPTTVNAKTDQPIKERYFVYNEDGSLNETFTSLSDAQYRASMNPGARVVNASSFENPSLIQRLRDSRPDDADRKAKEKASKIRPVRTWHQVFDKQGKLVTVYSEDEKDKAESHAMYIGGKLETKVNDPNKPLWRRLIED